MAGKTNDIHMPMVITITIVSLLLLTTTVYLLQAGFYYAQNREIQVKVVDPPNWEIENMNTQQLSNIQSYRWVDRGKGIVAIPIEIAMAITVRDLQSTRNQVNDDETQ